MRGFNVSEFRSAVNEKNILRTNRFLMEFTIPLGLLGIDTTSRNMNTVRRLEYWCEVTASPGLNLLAVDGRRYGYGPIEKRPINTTFTELNVTFYDDAKSDAWKFFNNWLRLINYSTLDSANRIAGGYSMDSYEVAYRQEYVTDANLLIYDQNGKLSRTITFREMFPLALSDAELNWNDNNSLLRMNVNLSFLEWHDATDNVASEVVLE